MLWNYGFLTHKTFIYQYVLLLLHYNNNIIIGDLNYGQKNFDKVIDSIDGEIGLIKIYDENNMQSFDVYLDGEYVCSCSMALTDNEIEDLVEDTLFHA